MHNASSRPALCNTTCSGPIRLEKEHVLTLRMRMEATCLMNEEEKKRGLKHLVLAQTLHQQCKDHAILPGLLCPWTEWEYTGKTTQSSSTQPDAILDAFPIYVPDTLDDDKFDTRCAGPKAQACTFVEMLH